MSTNFTFKQWLRSGAPWIWLNAAAVTVSLALLVGLIGLIASRGLAHFWVSDVYTFNYGEQGKVARYSGEITRQQLTDTEQLRSAGFDIDSNEKQINQTLVKIGNRDLYGLDFKWFIEQKISDFERPKNIITIERLEWGNYYGFAEDIIINGQPKNFQHNQLEDKIQERLAHVEQLREKIRFIEKGEINRINYRLEKLRLKERQQVLNKKAIPAAIEKERLELQAQYQEQLVELNRLREEIESDQLMTKSIDGTILNIPFEQIVRVYLANTLSTTDKIGLYFDKVWEFLADEPREANTEGGVFPAIFGTVIMVLLMTVLVTPLGVITAIYLHEYANQGWLTKLVRIAVNNLAGIPSIVYGVFGLGFFVYVLGGNIDELFFSESLPAPTFGTPGLLWASLTLALLTLPVVIVSTEEGLSRIPHSLRDASLALGATQVESLRRVILPIASPAIITGLILAIARAAGEVAPLMLVGVVKLAPTLAVDANFPFLHLDRKLMHLGFHIYDVGFQSPNVEAARPLVYATAFLLISIIVILNLSAVMLRNRLRDKYKILD